MEEEEAEAEEVGDDVDVPPQPLTPAEILHSPVGSEPAYGAASPGASDDAAAAFFSASRDRESALTGAGPVAAEPELPRNDPQ